ncbi:hypothetical protein PVA12_15930 [Escherichia coli]|nr:hypothetical protein [Shigella boydii]
MLINNDQTPYLTYYRILGLTVHASRLSLPEGTLGQWVTAARKGLGTPGSRTVAELESEI